MPISTAPLHYLIRWCPFLIGVDVLWWDSVSTGPACDFVPRSFCVALLQFCTNYKDLGFWYLKNPAGLTPSFFDRLDFISAARAPRLSTLRVFKLFISGTIHRNSVWSRQSVSCFHMTSCIMAFAARYGKRRSGIIAATLSAFPSMLINLTCRVPQRFFH